MSEDQPHIVVYPPDEEGGRMVRIGSDVPGRAFRMEGLIEFLRRAGWAGPKEWPPIEWRGGGPGVWAPELPEPPPG